MLCEYIFAIDLAASYHSNIKVHAPLVELDPHKTSLIADEVINIDILTFYQFFTVLNILLQISVFI